MSPRAVSRPAAELLESAAGELVALLGTLIGADAVTTDRFGVAVSGGADSLALLLIAKAALGERLSAASVDHRLREEAAAECRFVAGICHERGIAHATLTAAKPPVPASQAGARALRYALLDDWMAAAGINWLLTAHHADDQLETLVMRLNRSSAVGGIAGIRARNGRRLRPLLHWPRARLLAVVEAAGITPVADPSNDDERFDRVRIRHALMGQTLIDPVAAAASMAHLAAADSALHWVATRLVSERVTMDATGWQVDCRDLPAELRQRLIKQCIEKIGNKLVRGGDLDRLLNALSPGGTATLGGAKISRNPTRPDLWRICTAPPRTR
jgi:tRNA(Ile)-lysidine synthase